MKNHFIKKLYIGVLLFLFQIPQLALSQENDFNKYKVFWHKNPVTQDNTGTCWAFASTSFFESEIYRLSGKEVKLSEMYTVYWEYVERAIDFVNTRGNTYFDEGSESNATMYIWKKYGIAPESQYSGKLSLNDYYDHSAMVKQMKDYLENIKKTNIWNEKLVVDNIIAILNEFMGEPPTVFILNDKEYTPIQYLNDYLNIKINNYFSFISQKSSNYFEKAELIENDNWRHDDNYYNLPLKDYFKLITNSVETGYSVCICGDISEKGYRNADKIEKILASDIPSEYIDDDARQFRLSNYSTTDDHCMHIVGYMIIDGKYWFLFKDSNGSSFNSNNSGYRFFSEDYIKLKMMNILIHKDNAKEILNKIIK